MHHQRFHCCLILCLAFLLITVGTNTAKAADDRPIVTLTASHSTLAVGDVITITVQLTHTAENDMLPLTLDRGWGDFEVRGLSPVSIQANPDGSKTSTQEIGVTLWGLGAQGTPALSVKLVDALENQREIIAQPITLTVIPVLTESDTVLRDIKQQTTMPIPPVWPWVLAGSSFACVTVGYVGWQLVKNRRRKPATPSEIGPDLRTAYQIALDELSHLAQLQLPALRRFKEHYTLAVDILRRYLLAGFGIPAIDQTTSELRRALRQSALSAEQSDHLFAILSNADLVKFADMVPSDSEAAQLLSQARVFVLTTQHQSSSPTLTPAQVVAVKVGEQSEGQ